MKKYVISIILLLQLYAVSSIFSDDYTSQVHSKDKRAENIQEYTQSWARDNYLGTDTVYFWVQKYNSTQAITTGTNTKVTFGLTLRNDGDGWDATNNRFIAKKDGLYVFVAGVHMLSMADGDRVFAMLMINSGDGTELSGNNVRGPDFSMGAADNASGFTSGIFMLHANDYVEVYVYHDHGSNRSVQNDYQTYFQGARIR